MNSRDRVLAALNHKEPDRVPYDMGGTVVTGIHVNAYTALRDHLGLPKKAPVIIDVLQQLANVDDDVMDVLGVDVRNVAPRSSATFQVEVKETEDGEYSYFYDEWQIGWRSPKDHGLYYDMFDHPLSGPITEADFDNYRLPDANDPARFVGLTDAVKKVQDEGRAVLVGNMAAGIFELLLWTRGFIDGYADFVGNVSLSQKMLHAYKEMQMVYLDNIFNTVGGENIDVIQMADDMAGQENMLISPRSYRKYLKPLHKEMFDFIKARSDAKIFFHSCGAIRPVIGDLIDIGVDAINPVQISAANMDPFELKAEFGKDITFWGGGVDTQRAFDDKHSVEEVRDNVRRNLDALMPGGGFIFNTVHNIQGNVPPENIMAMWETMREYGVY